MKKIPTIFNRDSVKRNLVTEERTEEFSWVFRGEGVATRKWDGTCCLVQDGELYKRLDVKKGREKPEGFIPAQELDKITGHWPGWVKVDVANNFVRDGELYKRYDVKKGDKKNSSDKWHMAAFYDFEGEDGTYELCGPKVQGNPENLARHFLIKHGDWILHDVPRTFEGLKIWLSDMDIEGIVFHHPDGRMAKIKKKDFGLKR